MVIEKYAATNISVISICKQTKHLLWNNLAYITCVPKWTCGRLIATCIVTVRVKCCCWAILNGSERTWCP